MNWVVGICIKRCLYFVNFASLQKSLDTGLKQMPKILPWDELSESPIDLGHRWKLPLLLQNSNYRGT